MQIVSIGDNLHEMSNPDFCEKLEKNISKCSQLKILPGVLSIIKPVYRASISGYYRINQPALLVLLLSSNMTLSLTPQAGTI